MIGLLLLTLALDTCTTPPATSVEATATATYGEYGKALHADIGGLSYTIDAKHRLSRADRFITRLPMDGMRYIERAHLITIPRNRLIVGYGVADSDSCGTSIVALDVNNGHVLWSHSMSALNVGPMLYEGGRVFVSAEGTLVSLDESTGRVLWIVNGHWQGEDVSAFEAPRNVGEHLIYREWTPYETPPREFRVDKKTGEVSAVPTAP